VPDALPDGPFEALLGRLAPDRDAAGTRYEELRVRLVSVFEYRRCPHPEELADETLDRAARKLWELGDRFSGGDPARYVFGVAWNVARESFRRPATLPLPDGFETRARPGALPPDERDERAAACLEHCLGQLAEDDRDLVLGYHAGARRARIERRAGLARGLSLTPNALRLRIHRLTARLRECVEACLARGAMEPRLT